MSWNQVIAEERKGRRTKRQGRVSSGLERLSGRSWVWSFVRMGCGHVLGDSAAYPMRARFLQSAFSLIGLDCVWHSGGEATMASDNSSSEIAAVC